MKIGVFDSGVGGITVLNELRARLPGYHFLYFGDTANVPYGTKSEAQIQNLVMSASTRIRDHKIDALVIACNTAAGLALDQFTIAFKEIPLIDVVEAGVKTLIRARTKHPDSPILIFGTRATIQARIYSRLLHIEDTNLKVIEQECPLLVPMIEEGWIDHPVLHQTVALYTEAYRHLPPSLALLACTHYPWIKKAFERALPGWTILDSAQAVTEILSERLPYLARPSHSDSKTEYFFSDPKSVSRNLLAPPDEGWPSF